MKNSVLLIGILLATTALGQSISPATEIDLEQFAEELFQMQEDPIHYEDLYESLLMYYTSPLDLNKAGIDELSSLYILSPAQLHSFFSYREKQGKLISLYELQSIPGLDLATIRKLQPFVTVSERTDARPLVQRILHEENNYLLLRYSRTLQAREGYLREDGSGYTGDPNTLYGRFRVSHPGDFSLGATFEKDAGESFALNPAKKQYGFDFYSFHFMVENQGKLKRLVVGDYQLQYGQGLVLGSGFGAGKGAETTNSIKRNSLGIRPYTSVLESGFFRGAAATVSTGKLETTVFASHLRQDANITQDTAYSEFEAFAHSIQVTGLHRTASELAAKNQLAETSTGAVIRYSWGRRLQLGATALSSWYSRPLQKKPNNYNQFEFKGSHNLLSSLFATYSWQNFIFFGESAMSRSGGFAGIGGFIASLTPTIDFSWLIRRYDQDYHSFYGNALSENSRIINERGMYWGLKFRPNRKYQIAVYFDRFTFPWLKYRVNAPSEGFEYLGRITYRPSRTVTLYAQYRQEHKEITASQDDSPLSTLTPTYKRNFIFNIDYSLGRHFSMKTRAQGSHYHLGTTRTKGFALVQDLNLSYQKFRLSTRYALFETDDFNNAQYIYERDVLYAFSIPAYHGTGIRTYALLQYNASRSLRVYARYAIFRYTDRTVVGSGLSRISGNRMSQLKVMIRYTL